MMAGQVWAAQAAGVCLAVFAGALGACVVVGAVWGATGKMPVVPVAGKMPATPIIGRVPATPIMGRMRVAPEAVLVGLFVLIAWRSWAGLFAGGRSAGGCALMMLVGAAVTFAGKVAGGYLAERVGCWKVTAFSVVGSAALVFVCEPEWVVPWLVLLFIAQLATGPVLSLVYEKMERRGGTSFGLNCLGLFMGSLA